MQSGSGPALAVFASDKGPGAAERAEMLSQAGTFLAKHEARLLVLAEEGGVCVPVVTGAHAAGGAVTIFADQLFELPSALAGLDVERFAGQAGRMKALAERADAFVGLPGSLASAAALFRTWMAAGDRKSGRPVVLLNRNRAFEVMRGFSADVLSHSVANADRYIQYADTIDDLWARLARMLATR